MEYDDSMKDIVLKFYEISKTILNNNKELKKNANNSIALKDYIDNKRIENDLFEEFIEPSILIYSKYDLFDFLIDEIDAANENADSGLISMRINSRIINFEKTRTIKDYKNKEDFYYSLMFDCILSLKSDISLSILGIINSYLNNSNYKRGHDYLLNLKYNLAYVDESVEKELVNNKFNDEKVVWSSKLNFDILNYTKELLDNFKEQYYARIMHYIFKKKELIKDRELKDDVSYNNNLLIQILLRASLLLKNVKSIEIKNADNSNFSQIMMDTISNFKLDRENILELSFKKGEK